MHHHVRLVALLPLLAVAACGGANPDAKSPGSAVQRLRETASGAQCIGRQRIQKALSGSVPSAGPASKPEPYETDPGSGALSPAEAYRLAAPSTVIIRTREGLGSGVVVDPSGLVLTNHHVIDDFQQPDLTMHVSLELPQVEATGRLTRGKKVFEGRVVKSDPTKDLALVRILNPPKDLRAVKLSTIDPQVGENVLSIGHAGIGLLWAAKTCTVSGVGDQTRDASMLEVGDCSIRDQSDTDKEAGRRKEQCEARKKQIKEEVESATQGVAVQTGCNITHGDSGGPLLNARGELVGLNQSLRFDAATVAFHVHVAEIRHFLKQIPNGPVQVVPDPWCEGGSDASAQDLDGDGKRDTVILGGPSMARMFGADGGATFLDLDQDDAPSTRGGRAFDAEVIVFKKGDDLFAWYDTDNDGSYDVLLRNKEGDASVDLGWRLGAKGFVRDKELERGKTIDIERLKNVALRPRLGVLAQNLGWTKISSEATLAVQSTLTVPDPFADTLQDAQAMSNEGPDEKPSIVYGSSANGMVMMVDTRSEALRGLKGGDDAKRLYEQRLLKPQFVVLERPTGRWALYDTNSDGKLDLAFFAKNPIESRYGGGRGNYVTDAFDLSSGTPKPATDAIGRALVRPKLFSDAKLQKLVTSGGDGGGGDEGRATFPRASSMRSRTPFHFGELGKDPRRTIESIDKSTAMATVDLDGDTKGTATKTADDLLRQQTFDAEATFVRVGKMGWAFYDTDADGGYDLVLFGKDLHKDLVDAAYRIGKGGDATTVTTLPKGSLYQPDLVARTAKAKTDLKVVWDRVQSLTELDRKDDEDEPGGKPALPPPAPKK